MLVRVYQIRDVEKCKYMFASWKIAEKYFNLEDYRLDYEYILTATKPTTAKEDIYWDILEDVYCRFNMNRPDDFEGHSLSVSDVVMLDDDMYYCDSFGWRKIDG